MNYPAQDIRNLSRKIAHVIDQEHPATVTVALLSVLVAVERSVNIEKNHKGDYRLDEFCALVEGTIRDMMDIQETIGYTRPEREELN